MTDIENPEIIEQEQPQEQYYTENTPDFEETQEVECFVCQKKFKTKNPFEELCAECESEENKYYKKIAAEMKKKYPEYFEERMWKSWQYQS